MTLVKWIPKRNMTNLLDEVDQMISQAFNHPLQTRDGTFSYNPLMNIHETVNEYVISMDLPGVEKKDIEVKNEVVEENLVEDQPIELVVENAEETMSLPPKVLALLDELFED